MSGGQRHGRVLPEGWALPALTPTNRRWFTGGDVALQRCSACGTVQHPPEEVCHSCGSTSFATRVVAPFGTVHSYTVAHHAVHEALEGSVPYAVVLVSLDELPDVRVVGNLVGAPAGAAAIGMAVEAVWEERVAEDGDVILLPQWRPSTGRAPAG